MNRTTGVRQLLLPQIPSCVMEIKCTKYEVLLSVLRLYRVLMVSTSAE